MCNFIRFAGETVQWGNIKHLSGFYSNASAYDSALLLWNFVQMHVEPDFHSLAPGPHILEQPN